MSGVVVTVFSTLGCTHCAAAKRLLRRVQSSSVTVHVIPADSPETAGRYESAARQAGVGTVPLIFVGHELLGGRSELDVMWRQCGHDRASFEAQLQSLAKTTDEEAERLPSFLRPLTDVERQIAAEADSEHRAAQIEARLWSPATTGRAASLRHADYSSVVARMIARNQPRPQRHGCLWRHKDSFYGRELIVGVEDTGVDGLAVCRGLISENIVRFVRHDVPLSSDALAQSADALGASLLRFAWHAEPDTLNFQIPVCVPADAVKLAEELREWMACLVERHASDDGVDYFAMREDVNFIRFEACTALLREARLNSLDRFQRIAFGVNVYNTAVLHAFVRRGPPSGYLDLYRFFNTVGYNIGGFHYTLNELENGLLRGNRKPVGALLAPFKVHDPRRSWMVSPDFRIHFVLNCGAASCPPVKVVHAATLDSELDAAARAFLSTAQYDPASHTLTLSKIVQWYAEDFAGDTTRAGETPDLAVLWPYLPAAVTVAIDQRSDSRAVAIVYSSYDWTTDCVPRALSKALRFASDCAM
jgi:glutaredoxin